MEGTAEQASELEQLVPEELRPFIYGQRVVLLDEEAKAVKGVSFDLRKAGRLRAGLAYASRGTRSGSRKRWRFWKSAWPRRHCGTRTSGGSAFR